MSHTSTLASPPSAPRFPVRPTVPRRESRAAGLVVVPPVVVLGVAIILAVLTYTRFLEVDRHLWTNSTHDRNAHYLYALKLATDVRQGQWLRLLADLNEGRVWPPLHGVLAGTVLFLGKLDYRLAVLPSLAGWVGTALFGFLLARRAVPQGGNWAGWIAALFILASPSHRAFATDVMLESLGACLSLAALYFYLVMVQSAADSRWSGRLFGLSLTLLFLHKYNYWLLVVLGLGTATLVGHADAVRRPLFRWLAGINGRDVCRAQWRQPLNYVLFLLLALVGLLFWRGDTPVVLGDWSVSVYPPHNVIHAAYVVLFLRLLPVWRRVGRDWLNELDIRAAQVVRWHLVPLAFWFLLPKHPSNFLWYISLANASETQPLDLVAGCSSYTHWIVADYHASAWSALLAAVLVVVALLGRRRLRPGGQAVLWFVVLALVLTMAHPNRKGRNVHSWLAAGWAAAGMGMAVVVHGQLTARRRQWSSWLASVAFGGIVLAHVPALTAEAHAPEGGPHPGQPSLLELTASYLPELDHSTRTAILATVPVKPLVQWTYLERYGRFDRLEEHWYGFGPPGAGNRQGFLNWLQTTTCDTLVFFEKTSGPNVWEDVPQVRLHAELADLLFDQDVFREGKRCEFPRLGCTVHLWRRSR